MKYYIGIDGGGSKTEFICYDQNGRLVGEAILPTVHFMQVEDEEAIRVLRVGVKMILPENISLGNVFLCAGFGGYGRNQKVRKRIDAICEKCFKGMNYFVCNDGEIALNGAFEGDDGILIIAGTGSIGLAKMNGKIERCGGWGYQLGDEGSAYWIGKELLTEFCRQSDNRSQKSSLSRVVKEHFKLNDVYDLIPVINENSDREKIASLALIVYELAKENDEASLAIYHQAAKHLAELTNVLCKKFHEKCCVSYAGSVWTAGKYIEEPFKQYLNVNAEFRKPRYKPVFGAYLLAKKWSEEIYK